MANVTIQTNITNITDSQSTTTSVSLDGVPNTSFAVISGRKFTANTNYTFTSIPRISFDKTSNPNSYSYSLTKNNDGSYSFDVNYLRPISTLPTTDIIEFFGAAKLNIKPAGNKIYGWNLNTKNIRSSGENRVVRTVGDPGATYKLQVVERPIIGPVSNQVDICKEYVATINSDGTHEKMIHFPKSSLFTTYRVILSENVSNTFANNILSPTSIDILQYPLQQVKLQIIESGDTTWALPSAGVDSDYFLYSSQTSLSTGPYDFSFACTHTGDISADGTFTAADFTKTEGSGATLDLVKHPIKSTSVKFTNLSYTINNDVSPNTVTITGTIQIRHGYDAGGQTLITLNINDILNHA